MQSIQNLNQDGLILAAENTQVLRGNPDNFTDYSSWKRVRN